MAYCDIIVDVANEDVDHTFTYHIPDALTLVPGMRVQVPFGARKKIEGYVIRIKETTELPPARVRDVLDVMEDYPALLEHMMDLAVKLAREAHCPLCQTLRLMLPAQMRGGRIKEKTQEIAILTIDRSVSAQILASQKRAPKRVRVLECLLHAQDGQMPVAQLREQIGDCRDALFTLEKMGFVRLQREEALRRPYAADSEKIAADPMLTADQQHVLEELAPALRAGEGRFLLYGVTGSGKTEVFIRCVRTVLELGRTAIVLVPEIALTPQMVDYFRKRFGEDAAVLHSRLTAGERFDEWRRIRRGDARVVIGARSAIFAPLSDLGVIIIDEEHEQSYIADSSPRYDAREAARMRCDGEGATLILASATPSMRSFALAQRGDLTLLELPERVLGRPMPQVHLVDMREELQKGNMSVFSGPLVGALKRCIDGSHQAILFINRRGYATFVSCRSCGYVVKCPHCDVSLTYHQDGESMSCHYCGYQAPPPKICPECGSRYIRYFGSGTQKIEEEVKKMFPGVPVLRMDNDTTRTRDAHYQILSAFRRGEAKILIGTQMVAKGLDFPNVTLVGVVAADGMLGLPDYRAAERTFQLITQVAGRAGRDVNPGEVFVQTYAPEHYSITAAARQDYRAFFQEEMRRRRRQLFPPYTMLCRLLVEGEKTESVVRTSKALYAQMQAFFERHEESKRILIDLREMEAPVKLLRGKYRRQVFLKLIDRREAEDTLTKLSELAASDWIDVKVYAEINPNSMM